MRLTLVIPSGDISTVDVPADMTINDLTALAKSSFTIFNQLDASVHPILSINNKALNTNASSTLLQAGVHDNDLVLVSVPLNNWPSSSSRATPAPNVSSNNRLQMQDVVNQFWSKLSEQSPGQLDELKRKAELQTRINENHNLAMEYLPEAFADVIMLYIKGKVNGHPIKAFVDSGAQKTIISEEFAKLCELSDLIDERYSGVAQGVGTAKMIGRIHAAQLEVNSDEPRSTPLFLMCSFTVIEAGNNGVDMLFGLDMLKHHQACIDLSQNALRIQGQLIPFLAEHELPEKAKSKRRVAADDLDKKPAESSVKAPLQNGPSSSSTQEARSASPDEDKIQFLVNMGAQRTNAIQALTAAKGDIELAVSIMFDE